MFVFVQTGRATLSARFDRRLAAVEMFERRVCRGIASAVWRGRTRRHHPRRRRWTWLLGGGAIGGGSGVKLYADHDASTLSSEDLPLTYDPDCIEKFWSNHACISLVRLASVFAEIGPFALRTLFEFGPHRARRPAKERSADLKSLGERLRGHLTNLGPCFIKLGQMLSIRPDLLPSEVLYELQKLCDSVPSYPTADAMSVLEEQLGVSAQNMFIDLNEHSVPVAAASLGQVYKARLRSNGKEVAVKVQRPDMRRAVSLDLFLLRKYAQCVEAVKSALMACGVLGMRKQFDVLLIDNFASGSYLELDYENEASNQERFKTAFREKGVKGVYVPRVYREATSRKVLTTEWINGIQLAKSSPDVIRELVPTGVECFLTQLLDMGFFHSDPHPGNLLVNESGQLVLIDFGLCAEVSAPDSRGMTAAIVHLMAGDVNGLLDDAIELGFLPNDGSFDRERLLPALERIFEESKIAAEEFRGSSSFRSKERRLMFRAVSEELNDIFFTYPFMVPSYFALITRALIVLEGIAVSGDPRFDIFAASYPFAKQHAFRLFGWSELALLATSS